MKIAPSLAPLALLTTPLLAHPAPHQGPSKPPIVVIVLAHPDDELVFAPAIHAVVRDGTEVRLVFATKGDQGPGVSGLEKGSDLASARTEEAMCSGKALGVASTSLIGLGDGTLDIDTGKLGSDKRGLQWTMMQGMLDGADIVITWGPDGGYGHSDHRMVSAVVTQWVQAMPSEKRPRLLYPALIHTPLPEPLTSQGWATTAPDLATVRITYNDDDLAAATKATQCHKTQFDEATRAMLVPGFDAGVWKGEVAFRSAF